MKTKRLVAGVMFLPLLAAAFGVIEAFITIIIVGGILTFGVYKCSKVLDAPGQPPPAPDPNSIACVEINDVEVWTSDGAFWWFPPVMLANPIQNGFTFTYGLWFGNEPQVWYGTNTPAPEVMDPGSNTNSWDIENFVGGYALHIHWDSTNGYNTIQFIADNTAYVMVIECTTNLHDWFPVYTNECYRFELNQWTDTHVYYPQAFYRINQTTNSY